MNRDFKAIFDKGVDRQNTHCTKWDSRQAVFGSADVVPMWVADTDFPTPQEVIDALVARAQHGAFGYSNYSDEVKKAAVNWMKNHHHVDGLTEEMLLFTPGVVDALYMAVLALTKEDDLIAIQSPVYGPFSMVTRKAKRRIWENNLKRSADEHWTMDLDNLEEGLKQGVKMLILCSPHNPVGRVWTKQELTDLVSLLNRYGALLVSDEIHADLVLPGHTHTPICTVPGAEKAVMCIAPSKTFNLAGLQHSYMIVPNEEIREACKKQLEFCGVGGGNVFGEIACAAAYTYGEAWLQAQNEYVDGNRQYVESFIKANVPDVKVTPSEGTFLVWMDFGAWKLSEEDLRALLVRHGIGMNNGTFFGKDYGAFCRINLGTPRANVEKGMAAILSAYNEVHA